MSMQIKVFNGEAIEKINGLKRTIVAGHVQEFTTIVNMIILLNIEIPVITIC